MKKILFLPLLVLVAAGCNYQKPASSQQKQQAQTANSTNTPPAVYQGWQDYQNGELGFSLKLPADMVIKESQPSAKAYKHIDFSNKTDALEIQIQPVESVEVGGYYFGFWKQAAASSTRATIDGKSAMIFEDPGDSQSKPVSIYAVKNGDNYYVLLFGGSQLDNTEKAILNSFQFIQQTSTNKGLTSEDCNNFQEATTFSKPIPIIWTAKFDGCLMSCYGAAFTQVSNTNQKYPRFAGYYPNKNGKYLWDTDSNGISEGSQIPQEFQGNNLLRIYGQWTSIDNDHAHTVFNDQCVPIVEIRKIEQIQK